MIMVLNKENESCSTVEKYEIKLLNEFEKYSDDYPSEISTALDWVSCAQHYGLPTRLLDWTYNPYYGLYFSLNKKNDNYRLLVVKKGKHYFNHTMSHKKPEYPSDIYKSFLTDFKKNI